MVDRSKDARNDAELVETCNRGGREAARAYETLYRRHRDYVLRVAMRFTRDRELALDVLQDTFAYLLDKFPPTGAGLVLKARMTTFLYPVAKNLTITAMRKQQRFAASGSPSPDELPAESVAEPRGDELDRALSALSPERREVLVLRFVDDLSLGEIAEALEIPLGTVKSRLHLAIKTLRENPKIKDLFDA
jgi:RNA polymerase sigma-70 factor (ECF subfamily)